MSNQTQTLVEKVKKIAEQAKQIKLEEVAASLYDAVTAMKLVLGPGKDVRHWNERVLRIEPRIVPGYFRVEIRIGDRHEIKVAELEKLDIDTLLKVLDEKKYELLDQILSVIARELDEVAQHIGGLSEAVDQLEREVDRCIDQDP